MNTRQNDPSNTPLSPLPVRLFRTFVVAAALIALGAAMGFCDESIKIKNTNSKTTFAKNTWAESWSDAVTMSKASGKPIMLQFTGSDWCLWCQKLDQEVLNSSKFQTWSDRVIKIRVDFPEGYELPDHVEAQNKVLKDWYSDFVKSYPTCLFVEPSGRVIGTLGYVEGGPENWIDRAEGILLNVGDLTAHASLERFFR